MRWELEDHLTHEKVTFGKKGEWRIGREYDPSVTSKLLSSYELLESRAEAREKVLVPITADYEKSCKLLSSFVLSKVSREHGILGIDDQGPYFIDTSTNGTTLRDAHSSKVCEKGTKYYLSDGMVINLAVNYPLSLNKRMLLRDILKKIKAIFIDPF